MTKSKEEKRKEIRRGHQEEILGKNRRAAMASGRTEMEVGADGVAAIAIVNPPVNAISFDVIYSLKQNYEEALRRDDVQLLFLQGGIFSGGFDISVLGAIQKGKQLLKVNYISIDVMTDYLEAAGKPSVAAITGLALGAGLEISMICHARISTPTAQLSLLELRLGMMPGLGGSMTSLEKEELKHITFARNDVCPYQDW